MEPAPLIEVLFYQLERRPLERVLPDLLIRSLQRGWRAVVKVGAEERLDALNAELWSYDDASFLPHGASADGHAADQPVWLTLREENPNGAAVRFLVHGASAEGFSGYRRTVYLFDAGSEDAAAARDAWKAARTEGCDVTYWREDENGRWQKQG